MNFWDLILVQRAVPLETPDLRTGSLTTLFIFTCIQAYSSTLSHLYKTFYFIKEINVFITSLS